MTAEEWIKDKFGDNDFIKNTEFGSVDGHTFMSVFDLMEQYANEKDEPQLQRLYEWLINDNREPAQTKFTAGWLRNVAKEIEYRIKK